MKRIFVWDMEAASRSAMERFLRNRGFDVAAIDRSSGIERTLEREDWDLLFADPSPAVSDFVEVLVRVSRARPELPIFLVTYYGKHEDEITRLRPVCRHIFEKPVNLRQVDDALDKVFSGA